MNLGLILGSIVAMLFGVGVWMAGVMVMFEHVSDLETLGLKGQRLGYFLFGAVMTFVGCGMAVFAGATAMHIASGQGALWFEALGLA
ncbi:hypothetical protein N799_05185 [Lysobacter arseniciresistens ZS79]|uniref:Uncharacterized protein n=1 Tax=Lysobacter arseniciresistens ZS79 TaxID=913325 RepID=A0A0A0F525_9GAMM|nr:hypothetical protein [Lysobacter arseniciresistens]KGM57468.1 hypothetical protein N799_05185 [Lysobacter arseniciresistens ZS79]